MIAEIITVGTELLMGNILNTNAEFLSQKCATLGIRVLYHQSVGDNFDRLKSTVELAVSRSKLVIVSGGLGPTLDDITREGVAAAISGELIKSEAVEKDLRAYFKSCGREMTDNNLRQAMVIQGAVVVDNPNGTAPGMIIEHKGTTIMLLPGPPVELKPMFIGAMTEYIKKNLNRTIFSKILRLYDVSESLTESRIMDILKAQSNPTVAIYAKTGELSIRISAMAENNEQAMGLIEPVERSLRERLGDSIYSDMEDDSLAAHVLSVLRSRGRTLSVAESCTGGMLASALVDISGASDVFMSGIVCYSNRAKEELLKIKPQRLMKYGAVSEETAVDMVEGLIRVTGSSAGIAITGIAGPDGGSPEKPIGLVYISSYYRGDISVRQYNFRGSRENIRRSAVTYALIQLKKQITDVDEHSCKKYKHRVSATRIEKQPKS